MLHPRLWRDDNSTARCTSCAAVFSLLRCRRHHCRHCGDVFCDACTANRLWLRPSPPSSRSCGIDNIPPRGFVPELEEASGSVVPINASAVPSSFNRVASLRNADFFIEPSENDAHHTTLPSDNAAITAVASHHRSSSGDRFTASFAEAGVQTPQWTTVSRLRHEGGGRIENKGYAVNSAKSVTAGSAAPQMSLTPSQDSCHTQEARSIQHHRQMSSSLVSTSLYVVTTAAGDMSPQAWATPKTPASLEQKSSSHLLRGSSVILRGGASRCASLESDSLLQRHCLSKHQVDRSRHQKGIAAGNSNALNDWPHVHDTGGIASVNTASSTTRGSDAHSDNISGITVKEDNDNDAYRRECYKIDVDEVQGITWYLCRVCRSCYDSLLESVLDAHEASAAAAASPTSAGHANSELPLWYYVRLASPRESINTEDGLGKPRHLFRGKAPHCATPTPSAAAMRHTAVAMSNEALSPRTSVWAQLRALFLKPSLRELSTTTVLGMTAATPSSSLSPSTLPPCATLKSLRIGNRLVTRKSSPTAVAVQTPTKLTGNGYTSSVRFETARESDSFLALPPPSHTAPPVMSSTQPQKLSHQQRSQPSTSPLVHRIATPPRRRLISVGSSPDSVRQAVAVARRRRRIAVILIDERDVSGEDDSSESPLLSQRDSQCETSSTRPPKYADAEPALRPRTIVEPSLGTWRTNETLHIAPSAPQRVASEESDIRQQSRVTDRKAVQAAAAHTPAARPKFSVLVDDVTLGDVDGTAANSTSGSGTGALALRGLPPAAWLLHHLPIQAAALVSPCTTARPPSPFLSFSSMHRDASLGTRGAPFSIGAEVGIGPLASSKPIACMPDSTESAAAFSAHGTAAAARTATREHKRMPALPITPDSYACVLRALFCQIGAVVSPTTTPTARVCTTPTLTTPPTADCRGGGIPLMVNTTAAKRFFAGSALYGNATVSPMPLPGTGPNVYVAQRQALVRNMIEQYQRGPVAGISEVVPLFFAGASTSGACAGAVDHHDSPCFSDTAGQRGALGWYSSGSYMSSTGPRASGCSATTTYERVMAPVTTYFQLRQPAAACNPVPAAPGTAAVSTHLTILPVLTQVEVLGIPIDTSAALGAVASSGVRGGMGGAGTAIMSGLGGGDMSSRPFTLAEFLPQLAKRSTNLDGYVVVVLRCEGTRRTRGADRASLGGGTTVARPDPVDRCSVYPTVAHQGNTCSNSRERPMQPDGGSRWGTSALRRASSTCLSSSLQEEGRCSAPLSPRPQSLNQRQRRRHRVTELFGGQHLRLLYQQLQNCGVAHPAISIVEVSDEAELCSPKMLPVSLASGKNSPEEASFCRDELGAPVMSYPKACAAAGGESGVAEMGLAPLEPSSQSSALSDSGTSTASSAVSALLRWSSSVLTSAVASMPQGTEKTHAVLSTNGDLSEKRQAPAPVGVLPGKKAQWTVPPPTPEAPTTALQHAMSSLRVAARQLGVTTCDMSYASTTTTPLTGRASSSYSRESTWAATEATAAGASVPVVPTSPGVVMGNAPGGGTAVLARALESLVTTLVYRDISATLTQ